jgi:hypothetical protein
VRFDLLKSVDPVHGDRCLIAASLQPTGEQISIHLLIIYDQNMAPSFTFWDARCHGN